MTNHRKSGANDNLIHCIIENSGQFLHLLFQVPMVGLTIGLARRAVPAFADSGGTTPGVGHLDPCCDPRPAHSNLCCSEELNRPGFVGGSNS